MTFLELQQHQKELAAKIKKQKSMRKTARYGFVDGLLENTNTYRHYHIAYCLLRGRDIKQIEQPREGNEPNMVYVKQIMDSVPPRVIIEKEALHV